MFWIAPYFPLRPLDPSDGTGYMIGKVLTGTCAFCGGPRIDCCYNCEKSVCKDHDIPLVFLEHRLSGRPLIALGVCPDCVRDNKLEGL
jgi:hypothetical protein